MTRLALPKIYPITDTRISGLTHMEQVRRLANGGATFIQLRDKVTPAGEFFRTASRAVDFAGSVGLKIIINDRVDIAIALYADGVHLGQDDLPPLHARRLLGDGRIIGFSTHTIEQVRAALKLPVDYIAFGPIFGTSTKENPDPVVGLDGLRAARDIAKDVPLVAIGGITRSNVADVIAAGADSAAIISELLSSPDDITQTTEDVLRLANIVGN